MTDEASTAPELPASKRSRWFWSRVALSGLFALLTVALCLLWVRSYSRQHHLMVRVSESTILVFDSTNGRILVTKVQNSVDENPYWFDWNTVDISEQFAKFVAYLDNFAGFGCYSTSSVHSAILPYWIVCLLVAIATVSSLCRFRFTLRTLFTATTLVAVVLGLVVWLTD